jgi:hypothetical protein
LSIFQIEADFFKYYWLTTWLSLGVEAKIRGLSHFKHLHTALVGLIIYTKQVIFLSLKANIGARDVAQ